MILVQSDSFTVHMFKKILIMLMGNMYWNLFLSIIYILAAFFLPSSMYRLLLISFLIKQAFFHKAAIKSFFFSLKINASINGQRFSAAKLSSMSVAPTDLRFGYNVLIIA